MDFNEFFVLSGIDCLVNRGVSVYLVSLHNSSLTFLWPFIEH